MGSPANSNPASRKEERSVIKVEIPSCRAALPGRIEISVAAETTSINRIVSIVSP
jgi:hypothetical protein